MSLKGKVALVTGSTSGIGEGIARALAAQGASIMMNGFGDAAAIEQLRAGLAAEFSVKIGFCGADISKPDELEAMVRQTQAELGSLDILVNNAGIQFTADIADFPVAKWDQIIAINLSGAFYAMKAAIPGMKAKGWGRIINIASAHGLVASPQKAAYVAAKHGIIGLTKVAAIELANDGITANAICPGFFPSKMTQATLGTTGELIRDWTPTKRLGNDEDLKGLVVLLASEASRHITGQAIAVDGGASVI
jgi:3-hydroxybutyrate dehydrogenase